MPQPLRKYAKKQENGEENHVDDFHSHMRHRLGAKKGKRADIRALMRRDDSTFTCPKCHTYLNILLITHQCPNDYIPSPDGSKYVPGYPYDSISYCGACLTWWIFFNGMINGYEYLGWRKIDSLKWLKPILEDVFDDTLLQEIFSDLKPDTEVKNNP